MPITVYLNREFAVELKALAENDDRSVSKYVERILLGSEEIGEALMALDYRRSHPA